MHESGQISFGCFWRNSKKTDNRITSACVWHVATTTIIIIINNNNINDDDDDDNNNNNNNNNNNIQTCLCEMPNN